VSAGTAYGAKPLVDHFEQTNVSVLTDVCSFPVMVSAHGDVTVRVHFDSQGRVTAIEAHVTETDTFSANGNTLVGLPYPALDRLTFDSQGNITSEKVSGIIERVRLPNGKLFISAGLFHPDFTSEGGFTLVPDHGHSGDVGALCAALAA
jgi:hypothetical protein